MTSCKNTSDYEIFIFLKDFAYNYILTTRHREH